MTNKHLTKEQVISMFKEDFLPVIKERYESDGIIDHPARREAWNNFTDALCKNGEISERQYMNWDNPY